MAIQELNDSIRPLLKDLNERAFQKLPGTRYSQYLELDKPCLKELPASPYQFAHWKKATVGHNYHINIQGHYYSIQYQYIKKRVDVRLREKTIEFFYKGKLIASHLRSAQQGLYTTLDTHRPKAHSIYTKCTSENLLQEAGTIGEGALKWVEKVLADKNMHLSQKERVCSGVLRLSKTHTPERLEMALKRGLHFNLFKYKSIKSILKNNLDKQPLPEKIIPVSLPQQHENIRGADYYNNQKQGERQC